MKYLFSLFLFLLMFASGNSQTWEKINSIDFERNHGIGFTIGGFGYILTGGDSKTQNTNYISKTFNRYDPSTDTWEELQDYPGPIRGYSIGEVWEEKLYFGFGVTTDFNRLNDLWVFDPADDSFEELPSCPCVGRAHPALVVLDGKVYMGTGSGDGGNLNDWWQYDIATQEWGQLASIPGARHHPYQFVVNGDIFVGSGHRETWFKYNVFDDAWDQISNFDDRVAGTQFSHGNKGYALSGVDNFHEEYSKGEFWQYVPVADAWIELEPHPGNSRWAPISFIIDGYVYLFTGWTTPLEDAFNSYRYKLEDFVKTEEEEVAFFISIYPNPASDRLNIKLQQSLNAKSYQIISSQGQMMMEGAYQTDVDISALPAGIYWYNVQTENTKIRKAFVKQ